MAAVIQILKKFVAAEPWLLHICLEEVHTARDNTLNA